MKFEINKYQVFDVMGLIVGLTFFAAAGTYLYDYWVAGNARASHCEVLTSTESICVSGTKRWMLERIEGLKDERS